MTPDSDTPGRWQPSSTQTTEIATTLPDYIARSQNDRAHGIHPLDQYVCVYSGITVDGERAIHAEFLCREALESCGPRISDHWRTGEIGVDGGGACFFNVTYLADHREFLALRVNASR